MLLKWISRWLARKLINQEEIEDTVQSKAKVHWKNHEKGLFDKEEAERREANIREKIDPTEELIRRFEDSGRRYIGVSVILTGIAGVLVAICGFSWGLMTVYGLTLDVAGAAILTKNHFSPQRGYRFKVGQLGGGGDTNRFLKDMAQTQREQVVDSIYGVSLLLIGFIIQGVAELAGVL